MLHNILKARSLNEVLVTRGILNELLDPNETFINRIINDQ